MGCGLRTPCVATLLGVLVLGGCGRLRYESKQPETDAGPELMADVAAEGAVPMLWAPSNIDASLLSVGQAELLIDSAYGDWFFDTDTGGFTDFSGKVLPTPPDLARVGFLTYWQANLLDGKRSTAVDVWKIRRWVSGKRISTGGA